MADPTNSEIAAALDELGDLYELDGAVIHRIVAYRNAAKAIRDAPVSVTALARENRATELPGVGGIIQEKVIALADDGAIPAAEKLRAKFPPGLLAMTKLPGLGPKRARRLYEDLGVDSVTALRDAAEGRRIRELKGFGPKAEETLLAAAEAALQREAAGDADGGGARVRLSRALGVAEPLVAALRADDAAERVELAGSARRMTDSVKTSTSSPARPIRWRCQWPQRSSSSSSPRGRRARPGCGCAPTPGCRSTCGSSPPTSSATSCSTSPAAATTTWRCAPPRCGAACT